jgi:Glycosyltransferase family 87
MSRFGRSGPFAEQTEQTEHRAAATSRRVWWAWLLARLPGTASLVFFLPHAYAGREASDFNLYAGWSSKIPSGFLPYRDFQVVYPPGVMPFMVLPGSPVGLFRLAFVALALLVDIAVLRSLVRNGRHPIGSWLWVVAPLALGSIAWARFDIFVAAALVAAVLALEADRPTRAGAWLAYAALIKIWPLALLFAFAVMLRIRQARAMFIGAAATIAVFVVPPLAWGGFGGLRWMLHEQVGRGVQVESIMAVPLFIAQRAGVNERVRTAHGAAEIVGPGAAALSAVGTVAMLAAIVAVVVVVRRRALTADAAGAAAAVTLAVVAIVLLAGKVLSPQYMLWAVAAVAVSVDSVARPRRLFGWTVVALVATQFDYPFFYWQLTAPGAWGTVVAVMHGAVILGFCVVALAAAGQLLAQPAAPPPEPTDHDGVAAEATN